MAKPFLANVIFVRVRPQLPAAPVGLIRPWVREMVTPGRLPGCRQDPFHGVNEVIGFPADMVAKEWPEIRLPAGDGTGDLLPDDGGHDL